MLMIRNNNNARDIERLQAIPPLAPSSVYMPLRQVVFEALQRAIHDGSLTPGTSIIENQLAQHLGVSRTPVREALRQLEAEGLIELLPGRRAVVASASAQKIRDIYGIRLIVEVEALRNINPGHPILDDLRRLTDEADRHLRTGDAESFSRTNVSFHLGIVAALNNDTLNEILSSMNHTIGRYLGALFTHESRAVAGHAEHLEILKLLQAGKPEKAQVTMRQHLEAGRDLLVGEGLQALESRHNTDSI